VAVKRLGALVAALAVALLLVGLIVLAGGDTTVFVSPPEAVAEEFTRKLAAGRYDMALEHLEDGDHGMLAIVRTSGENLRARAGEINQVEGESSAITGDTATATVVIATADAGDLRWQFGLVRRYGEWKIQAWVQTSAGACLSDGDFSPGCITTAAGQVRGRLARVCTVREKATAGRLHTG
jgi:hypothetical protein